MSSAYWFNSFLYCSFVNTFIPFHSHITFCMFPSWSTKKNSSYTEYRPEVSGSTATLTYTYTAPVEGEYFFYLPSDYPREVTLKVNGKSSPVGVDFVEINVGDAYEFVYTEA